MSSGVAETSSATWYSTFCHPRQGNASDGTDDTPLDNAITVKSPIYRDLRTIYKAQPLKQPRHYLRLLKLLPNLTRDNALQCSLELVDLRWSEEYQYKAISYSRQRSAVTKAILVNGQRTRIQETIWSCFDALRLEKYCGYLWVEELCIDKSNVTERNHHAIKMDRIFRQASEVVVWLEGEDHEDSQAIPAMKKAVKLHSGELETESVTLEKPDQGLVSCSRCVLCSANQEVQLEAIKNLLAHPYWTQLESIQEAMLASKLSIYLGSQQTDRQILRDFLALSLRGKAQIRSIEDTKQVKHISGLGQDWTRLIFRGAPLQDIITMFADFGVCEDPRDRVYRLLSLVAPTQRIEVDYGLRSDGVFGRLLNQLVLCTGSPTYGVRTDGALLALAERLGVPRCWRQSTLDVPELRKQLALLKNRGLLVRQWQPSQLVELASRAYEREFGGDSDDWINGINTTKSHILPPRGPGNTERAIELLFRML